MNDALTKKNIAIVGAGLIGRMLGIALHQLGASITLFDKDAKSGTSSCGYTGAGMLAPITELDGAEPIIAKLGLDSLPLWRETIHALSQQVSNQQDLNQDVYSRYNGTLIVTHAADRPDFIRFQDAIRYHLKHPLMNPYQGWEAIKGIQWAKPIQETQALAPGLNKDIRQSMYIPDEGQLDNRELYRALASAIDSCNINWRTKVTVSELSPHTVELSGQQTTEHFDWVIDARGLGAKDTFNTLRGVRGEVIRVYAPEVNFQCPVRVMHPRHPIYIAPRRNNHYLIGATTIESNDMRDMTIQSALELLSAAYSVHSGFAEASIVEMNVNCRPALPDNLPQISIQPGLASINGLYRHGFLIAPKLIDLLCRSLQSMSIESAYNTIIQHKLSQQPIAQMAS
ncbi:MAG: FAD-dependent oxidoreductase [Cyanobacteria bacterium P01_H01_bin.74]